jgi:hypothetical protein
MPQILKRSTQYQLWLPYQTKPVVFLEYVAVGLAHGACAFTSIQKQKNLQGIYHSLNALMTSIFPVLYLFYPPLRVHHSLYGAIFKLIPSLNMKLLGAVLTASSLAYIGFSPQSPGYESYMQCPRRGKMEQVLHVYGLDNVLLDRLHVVLLGICGLCLEALGTALSSHLYKEELVQQKPSMDSVV